MIEVFFGASASSLSIARAIAMTGYARGMKLRAMVAILALSACTVPDLDPACPFDSDCALVSLDKECCPTCEPLAANQKTAAKRSSAGKWKRTPTTRLIPTCATPNPPSAKCVSGACVMKRYGAP